MNQTQRGFTLIELITVMILVGIMSVALMGRTGVGNTAGVQSGRDTLIAACFFAQQTAMARAVPGNTIRLIVGGNSIDVRENDTSLIGYPQTISGGVSLTSSTHTYDKLGRTTQGSVEITHTSGAEVTITLEASGYAHY